MSATAILAAALRKAAAESSAAIAQRYNYEVVEAPFKAPCIFKPTGWDNQFQPVEAWGTLVDGEWKFKTKIRGRDVPTDQISCVLTEETNKDGETVTIRKVKIKVQDTYILIKGDVATEVNRYRIHEIRVYDSEYGYQVLEGRCADKGNKGTPNNQRGNWHHVTWMQLSSNHVHIIYDRDPPVNASPCRYAVFMDPIRQGYEHPETGAWTVDDTCKIKHYTPVPGDVYCDKLRVFESAEDLNDWVSWYEQDSSWTPREVMEDRLIRPEVKIKGGKEVYVTRTEHSEEDIKPRYHVISFAYGESPSRIMDKLLGILKAEANERLCSEAEEALSPDVEY